MSEWREQALQEITEGYTYDGDRRKEVCDAEYIEWLEQKLTAVRGALMTDEDIKDYAIREYQPHLQPLITEVILEQRTRIEKVLDGEGK